MQLAHFLLINVSFLLPYQMLPDIYELLSLVLDWLGCKAQFSNSTGRSLQGASERSMLFSVKFSNQRLHSRTFNTLPYILHFLLLVAVTFNTQCLLNSSVVCSFESRNDANFQKWVYLEINADNNCFTRKKSSFGEIVFFTMIMHIYYRLQWQNNINNDKNCCIFYYILHISTFYRPYHIEFVIIYTRIN